MIVDRRETNQLEAVGYGPSLLNGFNNRIQTQASDFFDVT